MTGKKIIQMELLRKKLEEADSDVPGEMPCYLIDELMNAGVDAICGAEYRERSPERKCADHPVVGLNPEAVSQAP